MTIVNPKALLWALLAVPIVLLYVWRVPPRRRSVATGFLWRRVFAAPHRRSAWWPFRHLASLCVQLAVLTLIVLALAEPHLRPPLGLVLVIDNSASMSATDVEPTRLDHAQQLARQLIAALGYRDRMAIITAGDAVQVRCGLTSQHDTLEQALETVTATDGATRVVDAVALGRRLIEGEPHGKIIVLSDGCFDGAAALARHDGIELTAVGGASDNLAITRLETRRSLADPLKCQILAEVTSFSNEPADCRIELELGGKRIDAVPIGLAAAGRWRQVFEMTSADGGLLTARLDRPDVFWRDNQASARVPSCPTRQAVLATGGNRYLEEALRASPLVRLTVTDTVPEETADGAILVLHGRTPTRLPDGPALVIDPIGPCDLWDIGEPLKEATVARQNEGLPLMADVWLEGAQLSGVRRLALTEEARSTARPVAWTADEVPIGYAIERPGGRVLVLSGVLEGGDLPLRTAFPILMANALEWLAGSDGTRAGPFEAEPLAHQRREDGQLLGVRSWAGESDLRVPAGLASRPEILVPGPPGHPLWLFSAAAALLVVVVEWHLFQRRWTC